MAPSRTTLVVATLLASVLTGPCATAVTRHAPLLWRVERNGRTSHIFGTVHLPLDLDAALGEEGRAALANAKRVFLELDHSQDLTFMNQAIARSELPPRQSLHALLRPESWTRLTALSRGQFEPEMLDRLEPWFVALAAVRLSVPGKRVPALRHGRLPMDAEIEARARKRRIPVEALESTLEHLQVMSRMERTESVAIIEEALSYPETSRDQLAGLVNAYVSVDERQLRETFEHLVRQRPMLAERLLYRRNIKWCERLTRWLDDGRIFVAAGTFHMFGELGVPAILRQRGYHVERVPLPG